MVPYGLIPLVASVVLTGLYLNSEASWWSNVLVVGFHFAVFEGPFVTPAGRKQEDDCHENRPLKPVLGVSGRKIPLAAPGLWHSSSRPYGKSFN